MTQSSFKDLGVCFDMDTFSLFPGVNSRCLHKINMVLRGWLLKTGYHTLMYMVVRGNAFIYMHLCKTHHSIYLHPLHFCNTHMHGHMDTHIYDIE